MKELLIRSVFGLVFLATVFVPNILDIRYHITTFPLVLLLFTVIGIRELYAIASSAGRSPQLRSFSLFLALLLFAPSILAVLHSLSAGIPPFFSADLMQAPFPWIILSAQLLLILGFTVQIYTNREITRIFDRTFLLSLGYPLLPFALLAIAYSFGKPSVLPLALIPIYLNDTLAYVTGRLIGKHKMIPAVSPKKTWEGFFGGMAGTVLVMNIGVYVIEGTTNAKTVLIITTVSILASILATLGDLFESKLKRAAGVKDSGTLIPGHGGILDRVDAMLFVAPVLYVLLAFIF